MIRDLYQNTSGVSTLVAKVRTASENGTGVDLTGYESCLAVYNVGAQGDTLSGSVKKTLTLEESDDNSTFTTVAAADMEGSFPVIDASAKCSKSYFVGYIGRKQYLRGVETLAGTHTNGTPSSMVFVRGHARKNPTTHGT